MYEKQFGELQNTIWETVGNGEAHKLTEKIIKLERKINSDEKKRRDKVRDLIDEVRKSYRSIRIQVDKVSDKLTARS